MSVAKTSKKPVISRKRLPFSSLSVVYKSKTGSWRGFVAPFDVTHEGSSKKKVYEVLQDMRALYVDGLRRYGSPDHLAEVPFSDEEDAQKFNEISPVFLQNALTGNLKIDSKDFYAEAQLPA